MGTAALIAAAGACLGACADLARATSLAPEPIDASTPLAAKVQQAANTHYATPRFRDVPPAPTGVRPASAFAGEVRGAVAAREGVQAWAAANPSAQPADGAQTEAFAESQRARVPTGERAASPPVGSEEYAARLRAIATPPPPPR